MQKELHQLGLIRQQVESWITEQNVKAVRLLDSIDLLGDELTAQLEKSQEQVVRDVNRTRKQRELLEEDPIDIRARRKGMFKKGGKRWYTCREPNCRHSPFSTSNGRNTHEIDTHQKDYREYVRKPGGKVIRRPVNKLPLNLKLVS